MLELKVPETELYDEANGEFFTVKAQRIQLEHSLLSVSKWEARHHKPFLGKEAMQPAEELDYVRCMSLSCGVPEEAFRALGREQMAQVRDYISDPMTATWFSEREERRGSSETVTSEVIYYWMIVYGIPFECQKWHLNRLMTLVRVCQEKSATQKKAGRNEVLRRNARLNAARRKALHTRG